MKTNYYIRLRPWVSRDGVVARAQTLMRPPGRGRDKTCLLGQQMRYTPVCTCRHAGVTLSSSVGDQAPSLCCDIGTRKTQHVGTRCSVWITVSQVRGEIDCDFVVFLSCLYALQIMGLGCTYRYAVEPVYGLETSFENSVFHTVCYIAKGNINMSFGSA